MDKKETTENKENVVIDDFDFSMIDVLFPIKNLDYIKIITRKWKF